MNLSSMPIRVGFDEILAPRSVGAYMTGLGATYTLSAV